MTYKSNNVHQVQFCTSQFEDEISLFNLQQSLRSQETPEWQDQCLISPNNLSQNNIKINQVSDDSKKQVPFNVCIYHNRQYEYVCCNCRQIQCKLCQCLSFDEFDTFKVPVRQKETILSNSTNNQHRIVPIHKFLSLIRQENKNKADPKLHQYRIIEKKQKLKKKMGQLEKKISEIQKQTQICIEVLKKTANRSQVALRKQMKNFSQNITKEIEQQKKFVHYCQIINKIFTLDQDRNAIQLMIKKWSQISNKVQLGDTSKSTLIEFNNSNNLQKFRKSLDFIKHENSNEINGKFNSCIWAEKILQNLKKIRDQSEKTYEIIQRSEGTLAQLPFGPIQKQIKKQTKVNKQDMKLSIFNLSSRLALNQVRVNHKKQRLGNSITNLINRQIAKINKSQSKTLNSQVSNVFIYGGIHKSSLIQVYYPWHISKNKLTSSNLKIIQDLNQAPSHIGFGFAKLKDKTLANSHEFIIIGGFYSNEMSDCIFRVSCQKKKKQLVGRLTQPLAYFGFTSKITKRDCGKNTFLLYLCGGLNHFNEPVSTFTCLEFLQTASLLNKIDLPSLDQPRHSLSFSEHRSYFYAIGGINGQNKVLKTVTKFCPKAKSWVHFSDLCYERSHHTAISLRSGFYVIGGWNGQNYLRSVERLQQSRQSFHIIMDMKQARCSFGVIGCTQSNGIIILGGKNVSYLSSCQYLSIKNKSSCYIQSLKSPKSDFFCF